MGPLGAHAAQRLQVSRRLGGALFRRPWRKFLRCSRIERPCLEFKQYRALTQRNHGVPVAGRQLDAGRHLGARALRAEMDDIARGALAVKHNKRKQSAHRNQGLGFRIE